MRGRGYSSTAHNVGQMPRSASTYILPADSERCSRRNRAFRSAYRSPDSVRLMYGWVTVPVGARLLSDAALVPHVPGLAVSAAIPALGSDQGTKALCMMPCRARLLARCSLPRKGTLMPGSMPSRRRWRTWVAVVISSVGHRRQTGSISPTCHRLEGRMTSRSERGQHGLTG